MFKPKLGILFDYDIVTSYKGFEMSSIFLEIEQK